MFEYYIILGVGMIILAGLILSSGRQKLKEDTSTAIKLISRQILLEERLEIIRGSHDYITSTGRHRAAYEKEIKSIQKQIADLAIEIYKIQKRLGQ